MPLAELGLRTRLLVLVALAVIPAFVLIAYNTLVTREHGKAEAEQSALSLLRLATIEQTRLIVTTRQLLLSMSQLAAIKQPASAACNRSVADLQRANPQYSNLGVINLQGMVVCSAHPLQRPVYAGDRNYFNETRQTGDFSIGNYQIGRVTGLATIPFGYPVKDAAGKTQAVVFAAVDLAWLRQLAAGFRLPPGSSLVALDSNGTVLMRLPDMDDWVGKSVPYSSLMNAIKAGAGEAVGETEGLDKVRRIYAFAPLQKRTQGSVYIAVGIPLSVALAKANKEFILNVALLLLVAAFAFLAAWFGSDVFVLRRLRALASASRRLATGELGARSGLPHGSEEIGQLARDFDDMAIALQRVNRALRTLSAGKRALVRATSEQGLLTEMCRVIVEVGDYHSAWIGFAEQDDGKTMRLAAHAGWSDTKLLALAKAVSGISWNDGGLNQEPAGTAIAMGKMCVVRDTGAAADVLPWRSFARESGYASAVAFPLHVQAKAIGVIVINANEMDAFTPEELELLEETAQDLAFGIAVLRTRTEHALAHATIEHKNYYDDLTGLPNHLHFQKLMQSALTEVSGRSEMLALFSMGLNRLGEINDALGFQQGDKLLKEVSRRLRRQLSDEVLLARSRGDEFVAFLAVRSAEQAVNAAAAVANTLATPFQIGGINVEASLTVGIALFPHHSTDMASLLRCADVARRHAKQWGKSYALYEVDQDSDGAHRLALAAELRHAIEHDQLVLHYQPKVDMRSGEVCGSEALIRWNHPQRGLIVAEDFIDLAERTGLIKPLTEWVIAAALRQSAVWRKTGITLPVAINLSAINLHDANLVANIERSLSEHGADASWLELEITESAVMQDPQGALGVLERLRDHGILLFIDDFGTGYSSLGYLKKLPVDAVKIDKTFIVDLLTNADSAAIVRGTIALAHDLGLKAVAEGVEEAGIWSRLVKLRCDVGQGYFIGRPIPGTEFGQWLSSQPVKQLKPKTRKRSAAPGRSGRPSNEMR